MFNSPNLSLKLDWNSIPELNIGASAYFGKTQSTLYNGIGKSNSTAIVTADSSAVKVSMLGLDARYNVGNFNFKGQYIISNLSNINSYNIYRK